nr:DUF535 family protein [Pelotalea chapellei]
MSTLRCLASCLKAHKNTGIIKSSLRKLQQLFLFCVNFNGYLAIRKTLCSPGLCCIMRHNPRTPFKFVGNYISLSLSCTSRLSMLLHHYRFIDTHYVTAFSSDLLKEQINLWETQRVDDTYTVGLTISDHDLEGDLSLVLKRNMQKVYVLSFTVVPGEIIQGSGHTLFVSRIQGIKNPDIVRTATKALGDVSPPMILLTAARAIAMASGISCLAGVSSATQITVGEEDSPEQGCYFNYDEFWHSKGGLRMDNGLFRLSVAPHSKPDDAITGKHRTRTLRKRRFSDELLEKCREKFELTYLKKAETEAVKTSWSMHVATPLVALVTEALTIC